MKHYQLTVFLLLFAFISVSARELKPEEAKDILDGAEIVRVAFEENDAKAIADMTHPTLFETLGISKEQFISMTQAGLNQLEAAGVKMISSELKSPSEVIVSTHYEVVFIPRISIMEANQKRIKSTGFLIGLKDKMKSGWLFLDGSGLRKNPQMLEVLIPGLPEDLKLPPNTQKIM